MRVNVLLDKKIKHNKYLYSLNLTLVDEELAKFHGVKYVCMQGSPDRARELARKLAANFLDIDSKYFAPQNLSKESKYAVYRVGNILSVSHGMGNTSIITLLHSLTKLMYYSDNHNLEYIRIGTSGGLGVSPGSVILTDTAYMPDLTPGYKTSPLGKDVIYPTQMSKELNARILAAQPKDLRFSIFEGNSVAADDFYLGQARFDGAIKPDYDLAKREKYFTKLKELNILNFEMESTALASFCARAEIPATMIAVTILNRFNGDQMTASRQTLAEYSNHSQLVALNYLRAQLRR